VERVGAAVEAGRDAGVGDGDSGENQSDEGDHSIHGDGVDRSAATEIEYMLQ